MKCANCGAEIKPGCVYCSVCGTEAQIVSDYNLLEDDFLRDLLREKKKKRKNQQTSGKQKQELSEGREKLELSGKRKRKKKYPVWAVLMLLILVILVVGIFLIVTYAQSHSYEYQMKKAEDYQEKNEYQKAEKCLRRAMKLQSDSVDARIRMAKLCRIQKADDTAVQWLQEAIKMDDTCREAYEQLIQIYEEQEAYQEIQALSEKVTDEEILQLFEAYLPEIPEFGSQGGTYQGELSLELFAESDCEIYYTTDGSDPRQGNIYRSPILLEPGKDIRVRAVARNQFGIYSQEAEESFQLELKKPDMPQVTPYGGNFYSASSITVTVPEGCKVYYTWDNTVPTQDSRQYTEPINMPEGNNVLSLIVVDKYGMVSDVLRCNYIYIP